MFECEPTRRQFLLGSAAFTAWAGLPRIAAAGSRDPRLIVVILRGALDGLAAVAPVGDPNYESARHGLELPDTGPGAALPLDGFFALNPRLEHLAGLYQRGEALFVHASATPYRDRSHFAGQDMLENGTETERYHRDGWLGRALGLMPVAEQVGRHAGFAVASSTPLLMRGKAEILTWMPPGFAQASDDTRLRLLALYEHTDPGLAAIIESGLDLEDMVGTEREMIRSVRRDINARTDVPGGRRVEMIAASAARAMAADDGPRVGFLDLHGFDTHRTQRPVTGVLGRSLAVLDLTVGTLERVLGGVWRDTAVIAVTEFGRTVAMNGSDGTDHGTATVAMLFGGAVKGGRVVADWPGLAQRDLYEGRDLMPTTDLRALLKGVLRDHLSLGEPLLASKVFPGSEDVRALDGLIA